MSNHWNFTPKHCNWPNSQITKCTRSIAQNVPFRTEICTFGYGIGTLWSLWDSLWTGCLLYAEVQKWCWHMPGQQVIQLGHTWGHLQLVQGLIIETLWFFITIVMVESGNVFFICHDSLLLFSGKRNTSIQKHSTMQLPVPSSCNKERYKI